MRALLSEAPLDPAAVNRILADVSGSVSQTKLPQIRIDDAIKNGWVQFWYQPKINFRNKTLVGMEGSRDNFRRWL